MTEHHRKTIARLVDGYLNQRDESVADDVFAADLINHQGTLGATGTRDDVKAFVAMFHRALPDVRFTLDSVVIDGDAAAFRVTGRGTHRDEFLGVPATGRQIAFASISIVRFRESRIVERWNLTDLHGLLQQLTAND